MAIKEISPVHLDAGHEVETNATVLGGQVVKLVNGKLQKSVSTDAVANAFPYGFCYKASVEQKAEGYIPFNQYKAPMTTQSVILTKGALCEFWNDSTGAVFEADVHNAAEGTPLFISANGILTKTADSNASNVGSVQVATITKAPADANGVLVARIEL